MITLTMMSVLMTLACLIIVILILIMAMHDDANDADAKMKADDDECDQMGVMDEERRTTVNLYETIRPANKRVVFINTGPDPTLTTRFLPSSLQASYGTCHRFCCCCSVNPDVVVWSHCVVCCLS